MGEKQLKFSIASKLEEIDGAVVKTVEFAKDNGFNEDQIYAIDMAVREAIANAVKHGNQLNGSISVDVEARLVEDGLEIAVRDRGAGFTVEMVPDPTNPENLLKPDGRGILFMQNFIDAVEWHNHPEGGILVKMVKKF